MDIDFKEIARTVKAIIVRTLFRGLLMNVLDIEKVKLFTFNGTLIQGRINIHWLNTR